VSVSATYTYPDIDAWRTREYTPNISAMRGGAARILFANGAATGNGTGGICSVSLLFPDGYFQNRAGLVVEMSPVNNGDQGSDNFRMSIALIEQARVQVFNYMGRPATPSDSSMSASVGADVPRNIWIPPHDGVTSLVAYGKNLSGVIFQSMAMIELWDTPATAKA